MTREQIKLIAEQIAARVFEIGSDPGKPVTRIQYMTSRDGVEYPMGGSCLPSLENIVENAILELQIRDIIS